MTEKQYRLNKWGTRLLKNNRPLFNWANEADDIVDLLNALYDENEQLKSELSIYRKLASCRNCKYHDWDYNGEDEFEVCDEGNDVTEGICKKWEKF